MVAAIEKFESRTLLSDAQGLPVFFLYSETATNPTLPAGWTTVFDMDPQGFPSIRMTNTSGDRLELPKVKPDGSVSQSYAQL